MAAASAQPSSRRQPWPSRPWQPRRSLLLGVSLGLLGLGSLGSLGLLGGGGSLGLLGFGLLGGSLGGFLAAPSASLAFSALAASAAAFFSAALAACSALALAAASALSSLGTNRAASLRGRPRLPRQPWRPARGSLGAGVRARRRRREARLGRRRSGSPRRGGLGGIDADCLFTAVCAMTFLTAGSTPRAATGADAGAWRRRGRRLRAGFAFGHHLGGSKPRSSLYSAVCATWLPWTDASASAEGAARRESQHRGRDAPATGTGGRGVAMRCRRRSATVSRFFSGRIDNNAITSLSEAIGRGAGEKRRARGARRGGV